MKKSTVFRIIIAIILFHYPPPLFAVEVHDRMYKIGIVQITDIDQYNEAMDGLREGLKELGYVKGENITFIRRTVLGETRGIWDKLKLLSGLNKFLDEFFEAKVDVILTIGTPATKRSRDKIKARKIPHVFMAVLDPLAVGCKSMEKCDGFTGGSIFVDPHKCLNLIREILPEAKRIGIVYSDDENATSYFKRIDAIVGEHNFDLVGIQVKKNDDAGPAAEKMIQKDIDVVIQIPDVYYARDDYINGRIILKSFYREKIPLFAMSKDGCHMGATLAFSSEFYTIGKLSASLVHSVLTGKDPSDLPIIYQGRLNFYINIKAMKAMGIKIPPKILKITKKVDFWEGLEEEMNQ